MKFARLIQPIFIGIGLCITTQAYSVGQPPKVDDAWPYQVKNDAKWIYSTNGVHSDFGCNEDSSHCIAPRNATDPVDPKFPNHWISDWTMFTVMNEQASKDNPPPYTNPPATLSPDDYKVSYGTSYYDVAYVPEDHDGFGAMMEHYNDYCLPIFGLINNNFSCSFVSLGNKAFFLKYNDAKPQAAPECCQFSPLNHPPRPDFIKHLDYWPEASQQLNGSVQAYYWKDLWQADSDPKILFAYAFNKAKSPHGLAPKKDWYQHPQSFFFSGLIGRGAKQEPLEPIISQNYTSFRKQKPDAALWQQVAQWCPAEAIQKCRLFPDQRD